MDSFPVPATTWDEATDGQGKIIDSTLPRRLVFDKDDFDRWQLCLFAASKLTGNRHSAETRYLATVLFPMPVQFTADGKIEDSTTEGDPS